jgi:hypothetical protein
MGNRQWAKAFSTLNTNYLPPAPYTLSPTLNTQHPFLSYQDYDHFPRPVHSFEEDTLNIARHAWPGDK